MLEVEIRKLFDELLEVELANHLQKIGTGKKVALHLGELVDLTYIQNPLKAETLRQALDILIPKIIENRPDSDHDVNNTTELEAVMKACIFAGNYRATRDLIFYSFRSTEAVSWKISNKSIEIKVNDASFFRQIVCETQAFFLNSMTVFPISLTKNVEELLAQVAYWDMDDENTRKILEYLEQESVIKINHFYSYIPAESQVDIGGFSYSDFLKVYQSTLIVALYERRWSEIHHTTSVVTYQEDSLAGMHAANAAISSENCKLILRAIAQASRGTFNYFEQTQEYLLFPFTYSLVDQIAEVLKQHAKNNEGGFSSGCAPIIGASLVNKVSSYFQQYPNFRVFTEINLQKFDKSLPDIDVMAISYEPSFGFQFIISEVKNNLPANWAKEHLKLSDRNGALLKAVDQISKLKAFVNSPNGASLLQNLVRQGFSSLDFDKLFPTGFMGAIDFLIVTTQNIGVLLEKEDIHIISDDFLRHIVNRSDGDSIYIKHHLKTLDGILDDSYQVISDSFNMGDYQITYDVASLKHIITLEQNEYLSAGLLEQYEQDAIKDGYRYIDGLAPPAG